MVRKNDGRGAVLTEESVKMKDLRLGQKAGKKSSKNFGLSVDQSVQSGISHSLRSYNIWKVIIGQQRYYTPKDFKPEKNVISFLPLSNIKTHIFGTFF
jgi:hypothetical protein